MTVINFTVTVKGVLWHYMEIYPSDFKPKLGGFPCQQLCNHPMSRVHLTGIPNGCGIKKVFYGQRINPRRIMGIREHKLYYVIHQNLIYYDVPYWRRMLAKKLFSLAEWVLDR